MKRLFLFVLIGFTGIPAIAQNQNLSFGPTVGFGHAWMSNTTYRKFDAVGNAGVALVYSSSPHIGFGADLKYSREGGKIKVNAVEANINLDYICLPLKVIYFFGEYGDRLRPKIAAGPSFGFLVGGKREVKDETTIIEKQDATDVYKNFDAGLGVLAGINYRLVRNTWFVAELNYYNGFLNISEASTVKTRNRNVGLNVGVNVGIGTAKK